MAIKNLKELNLKGKRVLCRFDFNVPLDDKQQITNDMRIQAALPTFKYILEQGGKVIATSHLGRPKGKKVPEMSLKPVADRLSELLGKKVAFAPDCVGPEVERQCEAAYSRPGQGNRYVSSKKKVAKVRSQETIHRYLSTGKLPRYPKSRMHVPALRRRSLTEQQRKKS